LLIACSSFLRRAPSCLARDSAQPEAQAVLPPPSVSLIPCRHHYAPKAKCKERTPRYIAFRCTSNLLTDDNVTCSVGSEVETVTVEGIPFPAEITVGNPLSLVATGITDIEIHFLQIKYNAIGIYLHNTDNVLVKDHLQSWKGK
ncbi:unnamed protein product, partial [Urochloa humidicola]